MALCPSFGISVWVDSFIPRFLYLGVPSVLPLIIYFFMWHPSVMSIVRDFFLSYVLQFVISLFMVVSLWVGCSSLSYLVRSFVRYLFRSPFLYFIVRAFFLSLFSSCVIALCSSFVVY